MNTTFEVVGNPEFKLQSLLEADLVSVSEEIEEVTNGADNQLKIEHQLGEIKGNGERRSFCSQSGRIRGVHIFKATPMVIKEV